MICFTFKSSWFKSMMVSKVACSYDDLKLILQWKIEIVKKLLDFLVCIYKTTMYPIVSYSSIWTLIVGELAKFHLCSVLCSFFPELMLNTASQNIIRAKFTFSFIPIFLVICGTSIVISCPSCQEIVRFDSCNCYLTVPQVELVYNLGKYFFIPNQGLEFKVLSYEVTFGREYFTFQKWDFSVWIWINWIPKQILNIKCQILSNNKKNRMEEKCFLNEVLFSANTN